MLKVIRAKQYLDVNTGNIILNPTIIIQDDHIFQIGTQIPIPRNIPIIDLPDLTLIPGLIDCHTHITYHYDSTGRFGFGDIPNLEGAKENLLVTLLSGFTTIRDVGAENDQDFILRNLLHQGKILGPRLLISGEPIMSPEEDIQEKIQKGPDVIKIFNDGNFDQYQIRSIVDLASSYNLPVAVHSFDPRDIIQDALGGVSTIEHGTFLTEQAAEIMSQNETTLIPTLSMPRHYLANHERFNFSPENWEHFERLVQNDFQNVRLARAKGVNIVMGTDSVAGMAGHNANELILLNQAGFTPLECIQAATIRAACMLKIHDIGQIAPGFKADIIGIQGNPLMDLRLLLSENVRFVMFNGEIIKL